MNPNHAACFNELRELCRRYGIHIGPHHGNISFMFCNPEIGTLTRDIYYSEFFNELTDNIHVLISPPPETKGDKNE